MRPAPTADRPAQRMSFGAVTFICHFPGAAFRSRPPPYPSPSLSRNESGCVEPARASTLSSATCHIAVANPMNEESRGVAAYPPTANASRKGALAQRVALQVVLPGRSLMIGIRDWEVDEAAPPFRSDLAPRPLPACPPRQAGRSRHYLRTAHRANPKVIGETKALIETVVE